jgi:3'-phosphoadenosine 5'-phosphosulfate (PAPS) 3'-phosphatase
MRDLNALAADRTPAVQRAAAAITRGYGAAFTVERKQDDSPLTLADPECQKVIACAITAGKACSTGILSHSTTRPCYAKD